MRLPHLKLVAGLDLARRQDHSALVLLDVEPGRLTVTAALRLPQAPLCQQFTLIAPHLAGLDLLVFDQSGLGDAAAELLPKTPLHVGVCLVGGDRPLTRSAKRDRLVVGKSWLIQRLGAVMRSGALNVAEKAPGRDLLRRELADSSSSLAREASFGWRPLAAMTTLSSRRRSPCWRSILRPYEVRDYWRDLVAVHGRRLSSASGRLVLPGPPHPMF